MKKITAFMGFLGIAGLFAACSDSTTAPDIDEEQASVSDSSTETPASSSSGAKATTSSASASKSESSTSVRDTTIIRDTVRVEQEQGDYAVPYSSSGTFCWSAECNATENSATSTSSSSAATIEINMSSATPTPPLVSGSQMIDQRDQKSYSIAEIAGKLWMTTNINYQTSSGYFCSVEGGDDMCATYGGYYTYAAALRACPDGWRLPTEAEVTALDSTVEHEWWQVGGRFKITDDTATEYGLKEEQGYIWIQVEGENSSFRIKNYGGEDNLHEFQTGSTTERAYNVRCVQE